MKHTIALILLLWVMKLAAQPSATVSGKIPPFSGYYSQHIIARSLDAKMNGEENAESQTDIKEDAWVFVQSKYIKDSLMVEVRRYDSYHKLIDVRTLASSGIPSVWEGDNQSPILFCTDRTGNNLSILLIKGTLIAFLEAQSFSVSFSLSMNYTGPLLANNSFCEVEISFNGKDFFPLDQLIPMEKINGKTYAYPISEPESKRFYDQLKKQNGDVFSKNATIYYRFILSDANQTSIRTNVHQTSVGSKIKTRTHLYMEGDWRKQEEIVAKKQMSEKSDITQNNVPTFAASKTDVDSLIKVSMMERETTSIGIVEVSEPIVELKIYDNGVVDGDTISLFVNNKLVLPRRVVSQEPIVYKLSLNENSPEQQLVLFANNLGSIPPNTALMIINSGSKRFVLNPSTDLGKNAKLIFRYNPRLKEGAVMRK
jgi:hypothetical protein